MIDLYLKFTDEAAATAVLYTQEPTAWDEEGNVTATEPRPNFANISTIGIISKPTGETQQTDEGEMPVLAALDGWHVNVRVVDEDATALEQYAVTPAVPVRVWG
jgi:hypothetical protein